MVTVDGSSTVSPISEAVAEEFQNHQREAQRNSPEKKMIAVTVATSGTGGGFKKFIKGEIDINDASRPIKPKEIAACKKNGIEYLELKIAIDGLSVVVNKSNDWCDSLTVEQLRKIWEPNSSVKLWSDIDSNFPDTEIKLYGPDADSGTFDYFTEVICGQSGSIRKNYEQNANDNFLVKGVSGDKGALAYLGYAYYISNKNQLKVVKIVSPEKPHRPIEPTTKTIKNGSYRPLSRPLFLYVNRSSLKRTAVADFLRFYLGTEGQKLVAETGYIPLDAETQKAIQKKLNDAIDAHQ